MEHALKFEKVEALELSGEVSFTVPAGCAATIVTGRQEENELLLRLMLGVERPAAGRITLLGEDVGSVPEKALTALRRQVAVVHNNGGLVSNLKVWENLVLPLEYFSLFPPAEIEARGRGALARVGYVGELMELPGHLSLYGKRQVGLARAMLLQPKVIVYDEILAGLSGEQRSSMIQAVEAFHRESPGRTSLFLTADEDAVREMPIDARIEMKGSCING